MQGIKRITAATLLASSTVGAAQAAAVTDQLGQASFSDCYYANCSFGPWPAGLVSASTTWDLGNTPQELSFDVSGSTVSAPEVGAGIELTSLSVGSLSRELGSSALLEARLSGEFSFVGQGSGEGQVNFSGIRVDAVGKTIYADIQAPSAFTWQNVPVWTFSGVEGPWGVRWPGQPELLGSMPEWSHYTLSDLAMTARGAAVVAAGLGRTQPLEIQSLVVLPWGNLEMNLVYGHDVTGVPAIPEPSSVALLLAGLAATAVAARRRV